MSYRSFAPSPTNFPATPTGDVHNGSLTIDPPIKTIPYCYTHASYGGTPTYYLGAKAGVTSVPFVRGRSIVTPPDYLKLRPPYQHLKLNLQNESSPGQVDFRVLPTRAKSAYVKTGEHKKQRISSNSVNTNNNNYAMSNNFFVDQLATRLKAQNNGVFNKDSFGESGKLFTTFARRPVNTVTTETVPLYMVTSLSRPQTSEGARPKKIPAVDQSKPIPSAVNDVSKENTKPVVTEGGRFWRLKQSDIGKTKPTYRSKSLSRSSTEATLCSDDRLADVAKLSANETKSGDASKKQHRLTPLRRGKSVRAWSKQEEIGIVECQPDNYVLKATKTTVSTRKSRSANCNTVQSTRRPQSKKSAKVSGEKTGILKKKPPDAYKTDPEINLDKNGNVEKVIRQEINHEKCDSDKENTESDSTGSDIDDDDDSSDINEEEDDVSSTMSMDGCFSSLDGRLGGAEERLLDCVDDDEGGDGDELDQDEEEDEPETPTALAGDLPLFSPSAPERSAEESQAKAVGRRLSVPAVKRHSIPLLLGPGKEFPALIDSIFPNVPPVIRFVNEGDRVERLDWKYRKLLKWRMSTITPTVVKRAVTRAGFRVAKKSHEWLGYFGHHMKSSGFRNVREYQKVNHFPGSFQIGRKDRLWRNLSKLQARFGKSEFAFFPQTFVLPMDLIALKKVCDVNTNKIQRWIIKPPASARGIGIKVVSRWNQIPKRRHIVVQKYISHPYLINRSKFDLRVYVLATSYDPLRIYIHDNGLVRFASVQYSSKMSSLSNRYIHLTNYSVNKKNVNYQSNKDEDSCDGHKWSIKTLWSYLQDKGHDTDEIWTQIKDLVVKTVISVESSINSNVKMFCRRRACVHELFGFDILLDKALKPWILEVNICPSLHSNSPLDVQVKGAMIQDMFNIIGYQIPEREDLVPSPALIPGPTRLTPQYRPSSPRIMDKRLWENMCPLSPDEKTKHSFYSVRSTDTTVQATMLDILTPDDVRMLVETVDEENRSGGFQLAFPLPGEEGLRYLKLMETPRYYNLLLHGFVSRFHQEPEKGIELLSKLCQQEIHLKCPTADPTYQWRIPTSLKPLSAVGRLSPGGWDTSLAVRKSRPFTAPPSSDAPKPVAHPITASLLIQSTPEIEEEDEDEISLQTVEIDRTAHGDSCLVY